MGLDLDFIDDQTPLDEDEKEGLLLPTISTRSELDEFEQQNIEEAIQWVFSRTFKPETIFTSQFVNGIHKRMYGNVWAWAGKFRKTDKNMGIDKLQIPVAMKSLLDDARFWVTNKIYSPDEIAIRFKHRIVSIHCFSNGNGRHSRLMADVIVNKIYNQPMFSWGVDNLENPGNSRSAYIKAIKEADNGNYAPLLLFARS